MLTLLTVITESPGGVPPEIGSLGSSLATGGSALLLFRSLVLDPIFKHVEKAIELLERFVDAYTQSVENQRGKIG